MGKKRKGGKKKLGKKGKVFELFPFSLFELTYSPAQHSSIHPSIHPSIHLSIQHVLNTYYVSGTNLESRNLNLDQLLPSGISLSIEEDKDICE